jgi:membrane-bound lytic murein transglycosylase F
MSLLLRVLLSRVLLMCLVVMLAACSRLPPPEAQGELVLGMVAEPVIQFYDGSPAEGYTRDFAQMFADHLGLPVRFVMAANYQELSDWVKAGKVHVAAYVSAAADNADLQFSVPIGTRPLWVVKRVDQPGPKTLADLNGLEIHTPVGSAAGAALKALAPDVLPKLLENSDQDEMDIFEDLTQGRIALAAVDELYMQYAANIYPDLQPAVQLPGQRVFAWALPPSGSDALLKKLNAFIVESQQERLPKLRDKYFGYIRRLDAVGALAYMSDIQTKLPRYRTHFLKAQESTGIDWRQLAALAYQESKWEPDAVSFTGVRGMMMLTEATASSLGIKNRTDPGQSIEGGSRYLGELMARIPASTPQPDRLWQALAAYNLGLGHVYSGRTLVQGQKKSPDSWFEMKKVLPLLARPHIYQQFKMGRARGGEAVILVENVRSFYEILSNIEPPHIHSHPHSKTSGNSDVKNQAISSKKLRAKPRPKPAKSAKSAKPKSNNSKIVKTP